MVVIREQRQRPGKITDHWRGLIKIRQWGKYGRIEGQVFQRHWDIPPFFEAFFKPGQ
jgi:hypothetical protein